MHFGIVCAELPKDELLARLRNSAGEMIDRGSIADPNDFQPPPQEGSPVIIGERDGKTYLMDGSLLISGAEPDLILTVASTEPTALVVGCGAETVSGTYWLTAARGQELIRCYFHCHTSLRRPFERGTPLATEDDQPLDGNSDGHGLTAALKSLGFDFDTWYAQGPWQAFLYTGAGANEDAGNGPLGTAQDAHYAQFKLAPEEEPTIKIVARDRQGTVSVKDTGMKLSDMGKRRESGISRFFKRLSGR